MLPNLSNTSALLNMALNDINWVGFYLIQENELLLGPFQGKPACIHIPIGKGVCGTAVSEGKTMLIPDVHAFPGHIACDSASRSEIVIPLRNGDCIVGVLDIDSPTPQRFDEADQEGLEKLVRILEKGCDWSRL
jgi:GAF domain-containing protein